MADREEGHYWLAGTDGVSKTVGWWKDGNWYIAGLYAAVADGIYEVISPRMVPPEVGNHEIETVHYTDGMSATGTPPLPKLSPEQQRVNNALEPMLKYFSYDHLPEKLQAVSFGFRELAVWIVNNLPQSPERTVALRKLLESKDAAVRCKVYE